MIHIAYINRKCQTKTQNGLHDMYILNGESRHLA